MTVGDKVVCVDAKLSKPEVFVRSPNLAEGNVYVVTEMRLNPHSKTGIDVRVTEAKTFYRSNGYEAWFGSNRFRELHRAADINVSVNNSLCTGLR